MNFRWRLIVAAKGGPEHSSPLEEPPPHHQLLPQGSRQLRQDGRWQDAESHPSSPRKSLLQEVTVTHHLRPSSAMPLLSQGTPMGPPSQERPLGQTFFLQGGREPPTEEKVDTPGALKPSRAHQYPKPQFNSLTAH